MLGPAQPRAAGRAGRRTAAAAAGSLGLLALGLLAGRARAAGKVAPYNELPPPDQWSVEFTCKENTWTVRGGGGARRAPGTVGATSTPG